MRLVVCLSFGSVTLRQHLLGALPLWVFLLVSPRQHPRGGYDPACIIIITKIIGMVPRHSCFLLLVLHDDVNIIILRHQAPHCAQKDETTCSDEAPRKTDKASTRQTVVVSLSYFLHSSLCSCRMHPVLPRTTTFPLFVIIGISFGSLRQVGTLGLDT